MIDLNQTDSLGNMSALYLIINFYATLMFTGIFFKLFDKFKRITKQYNKILFIVTTAISIINAIILFKTNYFFKVGFKFGVFANNCMVFLLDTFGFYLFIALGGIIICCFAMLFKIYKDCNKS